MGPGGWPVLVGAVERVQASRGSPVAKGGESAGSEEARGRVARGPRRPEGKRRPGARA